MCVHVRVCLRCDSSACVCVCVCRQSPKAMNKTCMRWWWKLQSQWCVCLCAAGPGDPWCQSVGRNLSLKTSFFFEGLSFLMYQSQNCGKSSLVWFASCVCVCLCFEGKHFQINISTEPNRNLCPFPYYTHQGLHTLTFAPVIAPVLE